MSFKIDHALKAMKKRSINKKLLNYLLQVLESNPDEQTIADIIILLIDFGYNKLHQPKRKMRQTF